MKKKLAVILSLLMIAALFCAGCNFNAGKNYSITVTGGSADRASARAGETVTLAQNAAPAGGEFAGWSADVPGVEFDGDTFIMPASDVKITAIFGPVPVFSVTVNNGYATPSSAAAGTLITLTAQAPDGMSFVEWQINSGAVIITDNTFIMPRSGVEITAVCTALESSLLKNIYTDYFPVGCTLQTGNMNTYKNAGLTRQFNSLTAEYEMKWTGIQNTQGSFNYTASDKLVTFAKANGMGVRGHALVWYSQTPPWVLSSGTTKAQALDRMRTHIYNVVQYFDETVYCWDVVNEAVKDSPTAEQVNSGDIYRTGVSETGGPDKDWYAVCGRDYIAEAFRYARAALDEKGLTGVKLFYNDYNMIFENHRNAVIKMCEWLISEDVPIDGIGMQSHFKAHEYNFEANFEAGVKAFTDLGLDVQVTELDVSMYQYLTEDNKTSLTGPEYTQRAALQAAIYGSVFKVMRKYAAGQPAGKGSATGITTWGVADDQSWLNSYFSRTDYPLLFDRSYQKKPAYTSITTF